MSTLKPYTFAIPTSQRLTKNCKRVCLANALKDSYEEESTYPQQRLIRNAGFDSKIEIMNIK